MSFFIFSVVSLIVERTLCRSKNSKKGHVQPSRSFIPEEWRLGPSIQNGSTKNFEVMFFVSHTKNEAFKFFVLFRAIHFYARGTTRRPSDPSSSHPKKQCFFWSTWDISGTQLNSNKWKTFECYVLARFAENITSRFLVEPFRLDGPKRHFIGTDILDDCTWPFFEFLERLEVRSTTMLKTEDMKKDVPCAVCERHPSPTSGTTALCERLLALE